MLHEGKGEWTFVRVSGLQSSYSVLMLSVCVILIVAFILKNELVYILNFYLSRKWISGEYSETYKSRLAYTF